MSAALACIWLGLNAFTFALYGTDKRRARRKRWRIRERTLLTLMWAGGGVGALLGMRVFHHKTRHRAFALSAPCAAVFSAALLAAVFALQKP